MSASVRVVCVRARTWARVGDVADGGVPLGVWIDGRDGACRVLTVDVGCGAPFALAGGRVMRRVLTAWCREHRLRVHPSMGALLVALRAGVVVGYLPTWLPGLAVPLDSALSSALLEEA